MSSATKKKMVLTFDAKETSLCGIAIEKVIHLCFRGLL